MKDGLDFVMSEACGLAVDRRAEVATDEAQVGTAGLARFALAGDEIIHPSPAAFGFPRVPIRIEGAEHLAGVGVEQFIVLNIGVPCFRFTRLHPQAEDLPRQIEKAMDDPVDWEVGAQGFFVEVKTRPALFFRPVAGFPGFEGFYSSSRRLGFERLQGAGFILKLRPDACVHVLREMECGGGVFNNSPFGDKIGKMLLAKDASQLVTQLQNLRHKGLVVVWRLASDCRVGGPDGFAEGFVVGVGQYRDEGRRLQGKAPGGGLPLLGGALPSGLARGSRQSGKLSLFGDKYFPCIGGIEAIFGVFLGELGKLLLDFADCILLLGWQIGALFAEIGEGFLDMPPLVGVEGLEIDALSGGAESLPDSGVEGDVGEELGDCGQHGVIGGPQFGAIGDAVEVANETPSVIERLGGGLKGGKARLVVQRFIGLERFCEGIDRALRSLQGVLDIGLNCRGTEGGPGDFKILCEEGMLHGA